MVNAAMRRVCSATMKRGSEFARAFLAAVVIALAIGCGPAASPPSGPAAVAVTKVVAVPVVAGTSGDYAPWSTWQGGAEPQGLAPSIFTTFTRATSYEPRWTRFAWTEISEHLKRGTLEIAIDGMTVRPERSLAGRFTVPIASGGAVLLLKRPAWATSTALADLDKPALRVAVNRGGHLERVTRAKLAAATITTVPDNAAVRGLLARGEVDAVMTNTFEAPRWAEGLTAVERVGPISSDITAFWVRADKSELADRLDAWLVAEEASGKLIETRTQWLGEGAGPPAASPQFALIAATAERLALMPWVAAAKQKAGLPIEDLAQEEKVIAASKEAVEKALTARGARFRPSPESVERFFRLQIELAKLVQVRSFAKPPKSDAPPPSLDKELRPAIARISARMAFLAGHVAPGSNPVWAISMARTVLADSGLDERHVDELAKAATALQPSLPYR